MRVKLQLVMCHDDGHEETITDVITLNKNNKRIEYLGLTLSEAKQLLSTTQHHLLRQQVDAFLDTCSDCPDCGTPLKLKSRSSRSFRTLFGTLKFYSPRLAHCSCKRRKTASFRPLSTLLTESVSPELLYMEAKWSSLVSYGLSLNALKDFLPLDLHLDVQTVRYDTLHLAPSGRTLLISDVPDASPTESSHPQVCQCELCYGLCPSPIRSWRTPSARTITPTLDRLHLVIDDTITRMPYLPKHHLPAATRTPQRITTRTGQHAITVGLLRRNAIRPLDQPTQRHHQLSE